jgi:hypothetical protein
MYLKAQNDVLSRTPKYMGAEGPYNLCMRNTSTLHSSQSQHASEMSLTDMKMMKFQYLFFI